MIISVIAIFYNAEATVERCVNSILNQALREGDSLELIAVDDCSKDKTRDWLNRCSDPRLKTVYPSQNYGISHSRNSGMNAITGDCFFFIDGDDYLPDNALITLSSLWEDDVDWVQGAYRIVDENDKEKSINSHPDSSYRSHSQIESHFNELEFIYTHNRLISSKYKAYYFLEGEVHEDRLWNVMAFPFVEKIVTTSVPTYNYVSSDSSFSTRSRSSVKYIQSAVELMRKMLQLPECWSVQRETFLLTTIYKNLYLFGDKNLRNKCWSVLDPKYKVSIDIRPPFPRFPATIYRLLQKGVPNEIIKAFSLVYVFLSNILKRKY